MLLEFNILCNSAETEMESIIVAVVCDVAEILGKLVCRTLLGGGEG